MTTRQQIIRRRNALWVLIKKGRTRAGGSDTTAPTVTITLSDYALKSGETATVTFTFSEAPTGFTVADVTAPNGSLSSFGVSGDPLVYTATFTPTAGVQDATNVITVGTGWTDAAGNPPAGSTTSDNYTVDTARPTCTITCAQSSPTAISPLNMTFTFSEIVTGFEIGDITAAITGGTVTKSNFAGSGTTYTCDLAPSVTGSMTADVAEGVAQDAAGNTNTVATQFTIAITANVLAFNGTSARVNCASDAGLDNLADNEFTAEVWINCTNGATGARAVFGKGRYNVSGWHFIIIGNALDATVNCATTAAAKNGTVNLNDGNWHHVVFYFNDAGDRKIYIAIDGTWLTAGSAGNGAIVADNALDFLIGADYSTAPQYFWTGKTGWARVSNNDRYSHGVNFTPPGIKNYPASDANTLALWKADEGTGATLDNAQGTAARDGTLVNATWTTSTNP
jgi:hypothetical protein